MDWNRRYLRALKSLASRALAEQDPVCGGWLYELGPGHCNCPTRKHVGMAGFITAVLINGLSRYHELSGDARIPPAVGRAVTYLNRQMWSEADSAWRYTPCPASPLTGQPGVIIMALTHSVALTGDAEHRRVLQKAWQARLEVMGELQLDGFAPGKFYAWMTYGSPEADHLLSKRGRRAGRP